MKDGIVCLGEILLRLFPSQPYQRLVNAPQLSMDFAGAESNVAVSLSQFGNDVSFVTALPDNVIGEAARNSLRRYGVDTSFIYSGGDRIGSYYLEYGAALRSPMIIYDRKGSAFSQTRPSTFDWEKIFEHVRWFHVTGITPALSDDCAAMSLEAIKVACEKGITTSFDINYRRTLWPADRAARVLEQFFQYTHVLIGNPGVAADLFSWTGTEEQIMQRFFEKCPHAKLVATTHRIQHSASELDWSGMLYDGKQFCKSKLYKLNVIVDRIGSGDAFTAGLIHGVLKKWTLQETIEFAVAASALKHTIPADLNLVSTQEVLDVVNGNIHGYVKR